MIGPQRACALTCGAPTAPNACPQLTAAPDWQRTRKVAGRTDLTETIVG